MASPSVAAGRPNGEKKKGVATRKWSKNRGNLFLRSGGNTQCRLTVHSLFQTTVVTEKEGGCRHGSLHCGPLQREST